MRLSTDSDRDEPRARETITAAVAAGVTVFDTARAYGRDDTELGHNERLLASALHESGAHTRARIVTKGGMTRPGGAWIPDGRAKSILSDCEASLEALDGLAIDLYLLHAPDPRTPWRTSLRALGRLLDERLVGHVGLSNVNRPQLEEALELIPITAIEVALGPLDDRPVRAGLVERCADRGIAVIAHSPLGGPRRAGGLARRQSIAEVARAAAATPAEVALAWLLDLDPAIVAIPGARRPQTARSAARAATLGLVAEARESLRRELGGSRPVATVRRSHGEVVMVMGVPGAGKTRAAEEYVGRGYIRLNRDERGGGLRDLAHALDHELSHGARRVVLDNTYLTRASRSYVIETAMRHGIATRCVWLDTPLAAAQVNLVERLLDELDALPSPEELRQLARNRSGLLAPTSQMRTVRELEPPSIDEGFTHVEKIEFTRAPSRGRSGSGVFVAAVALERDGWERAIMEGNPEAPHLVFHWSPNGDPEALDDAVADLERHTTGPVERALCPHPAGPPICWCRPPLPGLALAFARAHDLDPARSVLIGTGPAHRNLAAALGARYLPV
jgi:aryl-alcohol dehydrogenase-like predicted oxidoreductase